MERRRIARIYSSSSSDDMSHPTDLTHERSRAPSKDLQEESNFFDVDRSRSQSSSPAPPQSSEAAAISSTSLANATTLNVTSGRNITAGPPTSIADVYNTPEMLDQLETSALMDGKFFKVCATVTDIQRIPVHCQLCTENKNLIGSLTVSTNLVKHLRRLHPQALDEYFAYKKIKRINMKRPQRTAQSEDEPSAKRPKISGKIGIEPDVFLDRILRFVIDTVSPLSIVDQPSFKDLFLGINVKLVSRRTVTRRLLEMNTQRVAVTKESLSKAKFVCTTADIWSAKRRSFIGVTGHFIDEEFKRQSFPLACKRFKGTHSYDKIGEILSSIHAAYGLDSRKIIATITDNAKNFVKAFEEFGVNISALRGLRDRSDISREIPSNAEDTESDSDDLDLSDIDSFDEPVTLPGHLRCSSHTLNLVSTTDLLNAIKEDPRLLNRHEKAIAKCTKLWHKAALPKSAEKITAMVGHTFSYPIVTRWNSLYDALTQIVASKNHLPVLFESLDLKDPFTPSEITYIEEYCQVMAPLARALDLLQGDNKVYYGILLPTLTVVKSELEHTSKGNLRYGSRLAKACLDGLTRRFDKILTFGDEDCRGLMAAITHPAFKIRWFEKANQKYNLNFDLNKMRNMFLNIAEPFQTSVQFESSEEDATSISSFLQIHASQRINSDSQCSADSIRTSNVTGSLMAYLNDKRTQFSMLDDYPVVKNMFYMFNTPLTSSAPVERLFSFAGITNTPKRNALSDENFEMLVLLKSFSKTRYELKTT